MLSVNTFVRILIDMGDLEKEGYIDILDPQAFPERPYRVVNRDGTKCLGRFAEHELECLPESGVTKIVV